MMSAEELLAEQEIRKERESFLKRKIGLAKKAEMLRRVWPLCDLKIQIDDNATGKSDFYVSTDKEFLSLLYLQENAPDRIGEILGPDDFESDDENANNENDDGAINDLTKPSRRTMKNIRRKKGPRQTTPKKKQDQELLRSSAFRIAQPQFFIKDVLLRDKQEQIGSRRIIPDRSRQLKLMEKKSEKFIWELPPLPILNSLEYTPISEA